LGITAQDWGVWRSVNSGTYTGTPTSTWTLSADYYKYPSWERVIGSETTGTSWTGKKLEGTTAGYGADFNTGKTWISIGETIGTYNPSAATTMYQVVSAGAWIGTEKFLSMVVDNGQSAKLQALNIPCVQVGSANLSGAANGVNMSMNEVRFFAPGNGGQPQIWATGKVGGEYSGNPAGTSVALIGGGLSASFNIQRWNDAKWLATVTNGSGALVSGGSQTTYTNPIQFRGAGAGTYSGTTSGSFSGTAAGVVKK